MCYYVGHLHWDFNLSMILPCLSIPMFSGSGSFLSSYLVISLVFCHIPLSLIVHVFHRNLYAHDFHDCVFQCCRRSFLTLAYYLFTIALLLLLMLSRFRYHSQNFSGTH